MAVRVHSQRGICASGPGLSGPAKAGPGLKAHGLAVWVTLDGDQGIDDAVMARAAELLLARALKIAPEAEVHVWPAAGAATSAAQAAPPGGPHGPAGSGTQGPSSSFPEDSPEDDDGATHLPPWAGPASLVSVDLAAGEVQLDGKPVALTGVEFKLLRYLVENCSRAISREELRLFLESFDSPAAASRSIDVYVGRVRRKLRRGRHAIATVRGGGYQFVPGPHAKVRGPAEYCI
jgi:two-component system OmpR family response regulator